MITGKNYIGNTLSKKGTKTYKTFNPKLNEVNHHQFYEATEEEINEATQLATEAFSVFSQTSGEKRAEFLNAIADEILVLDTELIDTYMSESGLPEGRAIGERGRTIFQLRMFADLVKNDEWRAPKIDLPDYDRKPIPKPDLRKMMIPLGPVVVFGASNFPLAYSTAGGDTASALAAGCPVIVKSHPMHAGTGELVSSAIIKAAEKTGMPNGVFSNINSSGIKVGEQLVLHPQVKAVGFTGSIYGGRALYNLAATRKEPIPVFAEMGSVNPVIITQKALENRASEIATTYSKSITLGAGQFCTNPGLLLAIKSNELTSFISDLGKKTIAQDPQCMLHPNIQNSFVKKGDAITNEAEINIVAEYKNTTSENYAGAKIVTISGDAFLANANLHQEVFGPFSMVVQCKYEVQLLEVISKLEGQLTGTILAEKEEYSQLGILVQTLQNRVGRIIFNGVPTGVEVCDAMTHGGPYPASTDSRFTAVGNGSILRWVRPFSYQDFPEELLPELLKN
ncbi:MAG: aldehyde dehydrogenase (NADP(+)) [Flavobacteriaceae bacterium]|nr:aldehyde dehydrogenase (NADP(+)) [Flavobacteriaceae bacterium]